MLPSGKKYMAAIIIGPIDKTGLPKIEAYLINFKSDLYGKILTIYPGKYLRPFQKFRSEAGLKRQIRRDILKIKPFLK